MANTPTLPEYLAVIEHENSISICLWNEKDKPFQLGEALYKEVQEAYMNGYNWAAVIKRFLEKKAPELLTNLGFDPEAGSCALYYKANNEHNLQNAYKVASWIEELVESSLFAFVKEEQAHIEWD